MATTTRMTIDEFLDSALVHEKPYRELVHGDAIPKMAPTRRHQQLEHALVHIFNLDEATASGEGLTELHVRFDDPVDERLLVPDFAWYRYPPEELDEVIQGPPDFVAEIRSPRQSLASLREKVAYYIAHGVECVWLLDPPAETVEVWAKEEAGTVYRRGDTLRFRAFTISVDDLYGFWDSYFEQGH